MPAKGRSQAKHEPKHSILLLTYKRADFVEARVNEIAHFYAPLKDVELIVVDNGSTDTKMNMMFYSLAQQASLNDWQMQYWTHRINENIGFGNGWNQSVHLANGEIVHLLSDDVRVFGDFIRPVSAALDNAPWALIGERMINYPAGWNQFGDDMPIAYLMGHYLAMRKETWEKLEGFDERYTPYDYEDVDLSMKAVKAGMPLIQLNLPMEHLAAGTIGYNTERYEHTCKMRAKFAEKWGLENFPKRP